MRLRCQILILERDHGEVSHPCLRVVGTSGVVEFPTLMEAVVSAFLSLSGSEGARCHQKLCIHTPA